jgi:hypothetical protein
MTIPIITRVNTIDEWRIQTNLSGSELNKLETGNYEKSNGVLTLSGPSSLVITSTGTPLQVSNNALFQSNITVEKDISVGVRAARTGNVTVGNIVTVYGQGAALQVANNALINVDMQVVRTIFTGNVRANGNITVGQNATVNGVLRIDGSGDKLYINTGSASVNTATITDLTSTNTTITTAVISEEEVTFSDIFDATINKANVTTFLNVGTTLSVVGNTTSGNLTTSNTTRTGSLVITNSANIGNSVFVTSNVHGGNVVTTGHTNTGTIRSSGTANIGSALNVVSDAHLGSNLIVTSNVSTSNIVASSLIYANTLRTEFDAEVGTHLRVIGNIQTGNISTPDFVYTRNVAANGFVTVGRDVIVSGNVLSSNVNAGDVQISGLVHAASLRTTGFANVGSGMSITGNTFTDNIVNSQHIQSDTLRTSGVANVGSGLTVSGNTNGTNFVASGLLHAEALRTTNRADIGTSIVVGTSANIGTTLEVVGNTYFGNVETSAAGVVKSRTLRTTNEAVIGGTLTVSGGTTLEGEVDVGGNFNVTGNLVIEGAVIFDTEQLVISANTPMLDAGFAYFGVYRGNTTGPTGTANANAYIRWSAPESQWQVRDIFNTNDGTAYSKILTANLISNSTDLDSSANIASSKAVYEANQFQIMANTSMKNYVDANVAILNNSITTNVSTLNNSITSNVNTLNSSITSNISAVLNYANTTFYAKTGGTISGDVAINGNLNVSGNVSYINSQQLQIGDNIIVLNADIPQASSPSENAGIEVDRGTSANTLLIWNESRDRWTFTNDGSSYSDIGSAAAESYANSAYLKANGAVQQAFVTITANGTSVVADSNNDTLTITSVIANGIFVTANAATDTIDIGLLNSGVTAGAYGNSISIPNYAVDAKGRLTSASNVTIRSATTSQTGIVQLEDSVTSSNTTTAAVPKSVKQAYDLASSKVTNAFVTITANGTSVVADSNNDTLTITSVIANGIFVTANAATDVIDIGLINSGVTSGSYGSNISVATFSVDAKGRLTSASNVTIRSATTSQTGIVQLEDSVTSSNTTTAAVPKSVKQAYDLAATKVTKSGDTMTGNLTMSGANSNIFGTANSILDGFIINGGTYT